jgi:hypothetical protein
MERVYVILNITDGKHSEAVHSLHAVPGIRWVDVLEGQWNIITILEASDRMRLAKQLIGALASVETITEDLQVLPAHNGSSLKYATKPLGGINTNKSRNPKQVLST